MIIRAELSDLACKLQVADGLMLTKAYIALYNIRRNEIPELIHELCDCRLVI